MDDIQTSAIQPIHNDSVKGPQDKEQQKHISKNPQVEDSMHHVHREKLQFGFEESALFGSGHQLPAYLSLIKYLAILMLLLSIGFTLPLCLIISNNKSSNSSTSVDSFTFGLSIFPIIALNAIDLLIYLAIPLYAVHLLILALLSLKLKQISTDINERGLFPTNYALLFRFPASPLSEADICKQIQSWFATEMKLNKQFFELFPQLIDSLDKDHSQFSSFFSAKNPKLIDSLFIQSILLSYNYEEYIKLRQEVDYLTSCIKQESATLKPQEIQNLIDIYNRKKNILNILPKNQYCLVIFKKISYARYFHQKTSGNLINNFFCPESYCSFELSGEGIDIYSSIFPNEINWQELHESSCERIKYSLCTVTINFIVIVVGVAFQFGSISLRYNNIISHSYEELYTVISTFLINLIVFFANKLLHHFCKKEVHPFYSRQKKSFIFQILLSNVIILTISPLCISYLVDSAIIYNTNGFISNQLFTMLFYALFSILNIYLLSSQTKEEEMPGFTRQHKIDYLLASHFAVLSIAYFLAPFYPIIIPFALVWFIAIYLIERYNIAHYYSINQAHGIKLISSMLKYFRKLSFLFILSISFIYSFASSKFSYHWSLSTVLLLSLLAIIFLFFQLFNFGPLLAKVPLSFKRQESLLNKGVSEQYSKTKENFLLLYETFNFAISYTLKQNKRCNNYSARIKIYEQMNTMSKTLSLSLKERLFSNLAPIMNNEKRMQRGQDHDQIYFEYQKKIHMNKMAPKVAIPPLFKRQEPVEQEPRADDMEMVNFNSIFSLDDKEARKMLKKHILKKLNSNVANQ